VIKKLMSHKKLHYRMLTCSFQCNKTWNITFCSFWIDTRNWHQLYAAPLPQHPTHTKYSSAHWTNQSPPYYRAGSYWTCQEPADTSQSLNYFLYSKSFFKFIFLTQKIGWFIFFSLKVFFLNYFLNLFMQHVFIVRIFF